MHEEIVDIVCRNFTENDRLKLMSGISRGLLLSIPTISRWIDQVRFDMIEFGRIDPPKDGDAPLTVYLRNLAALLWQKGKKEELTRIEDMLRQSEYSERVKRIEHDLSHRGNGLWRR